MQNIILASSSPRRKELFKLISKDFTPVPSNIEETLPPFLPVFEAPLSLARSKAAAVAPNYPGALVIGCDTAVFLQGKMLTKPKNEEDARHMLSMLGGKTHSVITGCCVLLEGKERAFAQKTEVTFFELSKEEINAYIQTGEYAGKAGAYGIQGKGALFVKKIDGDFYNVVGLPIARLAREIKALAPNAPL